MRKLVGIASKKISRHFLSELAEHDRINSTPARIRINRIIFMTKAFSIKTICTSKVPAINGLTCEC